MTTLYKLTDATWETRGQTKWGPGITHGPTSGKGDLCGPGWLHAYTSLELALLLNPIHAGIDNPVCWRAEGTVEKSDYGLKVGVRTLTTVEIIEPPTVTTERRVRFAILCAAEVCDNKMWREWAASWLSGKDRATTTAAWAATAAAEAATVAAAAWEAREAAAVARVAREAAAWEAAWEAARAAEAAAQTAAWIIQNVQEAKVVRVPLDLDALAKKAIYGTEE